MARVSVVVAAFNVEEYLGRCLDSILSQTRGEIEVIVVDDGSTDSSGKVADRYAGLDRRITVVHQINGGLSAARNAGLRRAHGEFICFVDGDDWIEPNLVERATDHAKATSSDIVVSGSIVDTHDWADRRLSSTIQLPRRLVMDDGRLLRSGESDDRLVKLVGYAWNKLYRRELLVRDGLEFEEGLSLVEDVVFNARAFTSAIRVAFLDEAFVHYVQRPRTTLGTRPYPDLLSLRLRAMSSIEQILSRWGVPEPERARRASALAVEALIGAVRSTATRSDIPAKQRRQMLQAMLEQPDGMQILGTARQLPAPRTRDRMLLGLLSSSKFWLALIPASVDHFLRKG